MKNNSVKITSHDLIETNSYNNSEENSCEGSLNLGPAANDCSNNVESLCENSIDLYEEIVSSNQEKNDADSSPTADFYSSKKKKNKSVRYQKKRKLSKNLVMILKN